MCWLTLMQLFVDARYIVPWSLTAHNAFHLELT
jgi:hypothetical protein